MSRGTDRILALAAANLRASPVKSAVLLGGTIVLIFLVARQVWGGAKKAEAAIEIAVPLTTADDGGSQGAARPAKRRPPPRLRQTLRRDPFKCSWIGSFERAGDVEAADSETGDEELVLQFTLKGADGGAPAIAVISGVVVRPGSMVAGYRVVSIGARQVVLRNAAEETTLRMR